MRKLLLLLSLNPRCSPSLPPALAGLRRSPPSAPQLRPFAFISCRRRGVSPGYLGFLTGRNLLKQTETPLRLLRVGIKWWIRSLKISLRRRRHFPKPNGVVISLFGANVAVFILWKIGDPKFMRENFMVSLDNFKSGRLHTLVTCAFSHSDPEHLIINMMTLYLFGASVGRLFGPQFVMKLYLSGAIGGSIFFLLHKALIAPSSKGASAAVNAIMLLKIFLFPKNIIYVNLITPLPAIYVGALIIGTDLWIIKQGEGKISGFAHLGAAVVAALVWAGIKKPWI